MARADLTPYAVGLMRLNEMAIAQENFLKEEIEYIGYCSINRIEVVLCKVGNYWGIRGRMESQLHEYQVIHGCAGQIRAYWLIRGKKIKALRPHPVGTTAELVKAYKARESYCKPVDEMDAAEIFAAAKGKRPSRRKAPKMTSNQRIANGIRMEKI